LFIICAGWVVSSSIIGFLFTAVSTPLLWRLLRIHYNLIDIPRGDVPDGVFWGIYGLYAAILFVEFPLLKEFRLVNTTWKLLFFFLTSLASVVTPLVIVAIPRNSSTIDLNIRCGSWLTPSTAGSGVSCTPVLNAESRVALTVMAAGFAIPLVLMVRRAYEDGLDARKRSKLPKTARDPDSATGDEPSQIS
jgi:hypothetical protein